MKTQYHLTSMHLLILFVLMLLSIMASPASSRVREMPKLPIANIKHIDGITRTLRS